MTFKNLGLKCRCMIRRTIFKDLIDHLDQKEISLIIGPRQAGKTTLMLACKDFLEKKGEKTVFLNLDIESNKQFFDSQEKLARKIQLEIGQNKGFVFIDEIQRKENAGLFLKGLFDLGLPYKLIVSGSGSLELKEKIHESLVGRKRIFELSTLSFLEFVNFKTDYKYEEKLNEFFEVEGETGKFLLEEYLNFGGYPRVVLADTLDEKQKVLGEIYQSYLEKDIVYLLGLPKTETLTALVKILASQIGNLVNFSELANSLGVSVQTVKNYLWYLEKTFILKKVTPYFSNVRKEITKSPLFYFEDLGLRNYSLGLFGNLNLPAETGFLFENFVFKILKEKIGLSAAKINFWRSKEGAEVDFVIEAGQRVLPIEVKYQNFKKPEVSRSLRSFLEKYQPSKALVVNLALTDKVEVKSSQVLFLPYFDLLFTHLTNL